MQQELQAAEADVKWVAPEGIHLTLKFLGEVSPELAAEIKKQLDELAKHQQRFELSINRVGAFPKIEYPRVIWVGIEHGAESTIKLAQALEEKLLNLGFLKEKRPFRPHLTLGRVRSSHNRQQLRELLQSVAVQPQTMSAQTIVLFKSTLTPQGALYGALHKIKLS